MDANLKKIVDIRIKTVIRALEANNYVARFVESKEDALKLVDQIIPEGVLTATGGSATLNECGIIDLLKKKTNYADRNAQTTPEGRREAEPARHAVYECPSPVGKEKHGQCPTQDGRPGGRHGHQPRTIIPQGEGSYRPFARRTAQTDATAKGI